MKSLIVLFAVISLACGMQEGGFRIRFDSGLPEDMGQTYFYDIPRHLDGAIRQGWTRQPRADDHLPALQLYCAPELTCCVMYDTTGYVAGLQVALDQDKYTDSIYDWETQGFTEWEPAKDGKRYWTTQQFFVDERYLAIDDDTRVSSREQHKTLQTDGIWVRSTRGQLLKISTTKEGIDNSDFTEQACIPWMGNHYYYNMSSNTECTSEGIMPWFPLVNDGELIGTGLLTFGKLPIEEGKRDWFERPNSMVVKAIVPRAPACLYEVADNPGVVTMHIYYIDDPRSMLCV